MVHAAFGGSTNLLLHIPAIAHQAGLRLPTVEDWIRINQAVPRLVDVLPNGPKYHPTVRAFMAGGVPEVMLYLRELGILHLDAMTVTGCTVGENLEWWEKSERRQRFKEILEKQEGVLPDDVIMSPEVAKERGLTSTITFPVGNIAPEGSVIKSTAIDPKVIDENGIYYHKGPCKVYLSEKSAVYDIKHEKVKKGDILVIIGTGPSGTGMEDLSGDELLEAPLLRQVRFPHHRRALLGRFDGRLRGPRRSRSARGRPDREAPHGRHRGNPHRLQKPPRHRQLPRHC